jgi:tetratricopeptide (TPR) repeat protein
VAAASLLLAILVGALGFWSARRSRIHDQVARHIEQAGLLAAAGDHHAASTQVAIAESLAQDEFAGRDYDEQVSHWKNQLSAYQQFLQKSETAREYIWAGTKSFGDQWNPVFEDLTPQKCREALDVYGVLSNPDWEQGLSNRVLTADQRARVKREAEELLVLLALRTAVGAGNDQQGNEKRREALAILEVADRCGTLGPGVNSLRMLWHRALGEDEKADAAGDRGVELAKTGRDPGDVIDRYVLAQIVHVILDRPGDAIPLYERVLKIQPDHVRSHQALFDCYYELSDVAGQRRHLEVCVALRPANPMFNYFRGMSYFAERDYRRALNDFDAAVQKDKDFALGYFYRGRMHVVYGDWESAERDFSAALNVDHQDRSAYLWRAVARGKLGRYEQAAADAELALELREDDALSHYYAARAYAQAAGAASADIQNRPKSHELAERYRQKAVQLLNRGIELGFDDFSRVVPGGDFTPVYASAEYRRLVLDALAERIGKREAELAENAADLKQRLQLAEWYLAEIEIRTGVEPPEDADIQQLDKALSLFQDLVKEGRQSDVTFISRVLQRKAELLDRLGMADKAEKTWQMMAMVDKLSPARLAVDRARNLAKWGNHARAWELLAGHLESSDMQGGNCYQAACVLALAANAAADDLQLDDQSRTGLVREYSDRAVRLLQRAMEQDYFQKESARQALQRNSELDVIRDRAEFRKLLAETKVAASERENAKQAENSR